MNKSIYDVKPISKLEKDNYISRFVDDKDGRRVNLTLTDLGEEILKKIAPDMDVVYKAIHNRYGEEKLTTLLEILSEVGEWKGR